MVDYIINMNTLIILPHGNKQSKIIEKNRELIVNCIPNRVIKKNCIQYGSTLENRQKWTENLTGDCYKVPVSLRDDGSIILFPTTSPRLNKVSWVVLNNVKNSYYDRRNKGTVIEFNNDSSVIVNISNNIISNQILKATRLEYVLRKNKVINS